MKQNMKANKTRSNDYLDELIGKRVVLFCLSYFYEGVLVGFNDTCVKLEDTGIIYETGSFTDAKWKNFQKFGPGPHYVPRAAIESFREGK